MSKRVFKNPKLLRKMILPSDLKKAEGERVVVKYTLLTWQQRKLLTYSRMDLSNFQQGQLNFKLNFGEMIDILKFSVKGAEYEDGTQLELEGGQKLPRRFESEKDIDLFLSLLSDTDIMEVAMKIYNESSLNEEKKRI